MRQRHINSVRVCVSISKCPFYGKCGGCKFDFTSPDYHADKQSIIKNVPVTNDPVWIAPGARRRAEFAFLNDAFGFYAHRSNDIIPIDHCPLLTPAINDVLPEIAKFPWVGAGRLLITECENGLDLVVIDPTIARPARGITGAAETVPSIIRMVWGDMVVKQTAEAILRFGDKTVKYPGGFLQPSKPGEEALRNLVVNAAAGANKVADLFSGLGTFTFALNADGYDVRGAKHKRDLFTKPLRVSELNKYDCVVMDPPRAGAQAQVTMLGKSDVKKVVYVSCNPETFMRDIQILQQGGYRLTELTPVDQFVGSTHWELVGVFNK